jgi:hypothetical protein
VRNNYLIALAAILLAACAAAPNEPGAVAEDDPIADYIRVAELPEVDAIRSLGQLQHRIISEDYVIVYDRKTSHLATFARPCRELFEIEVTPDVRHDSNSLRARFDTLRGCRIQSLYRVSDGQVAEILQLGGAPGK